MKEAWAATSVHMITVRSSTAPVHAAPQRGFEGRVSAAERTK
jgi:hypothetical protein